MKKKLEKYLNKFRNQKRAIIWVWVVVLMAIVVFAIAWFTLGWAAFEIIDAAEEAYDFEEPATSTITLIKNVISWLAVIAIFGWIIYGYVNSQRRDPRLYEDY